MPHKKVLIIAEAGVNHNGDMSIAKRLIDIAAEAGADFVKFQTYKTENLVTHKAVKANYQIENFRESKEVTQFEMLKGLELSFSNFIELSNYCNLNKIAFLSTGFDMESLDFLNTLGLPIFKIPSGEITNLLYLKKIASFGKPIILSTGMATIDEIFDAINVLYANGIDNELISLLHCTTEYPTPFEEANLLAIKTMQAKFNVDVGYSDHTLGIEASIAAVALGATIIEKHFTIDRQMAGPDHKASIEPLELKQLVTCIRNIEKGLGNGDKKPTISEMKNITVARKSLHTVLSIKEGEILTPNMLTSKRPGNGISPMKIDEIIGKKVNKTLPADYLLSLDDLL